MANIPVLLKDFIKLVDFLSRMSSQSLMRSAGKCLNLHFLVEHPVPHSTDILREGRLDDTCGAVGRSTDLVPERTAKGS
jgi:hypothetical protein